MDKRKGLLRLVISLVCLAAVVGLGVACGQEIDPDYPCGKAAFTYAEHVRDMRLKYEPLFQRQPGIQDIYESFLRDEKGDWSEEYGILITVHEKVDQDTLPPESRIPNEVEGVPVFIVDRDDGWVNDDFAMKRDSERAYVDAVFLKYLFLMREQHNYSNAWYEHSKYDPVTGEGYGALRIVVFVDEGEKVDQSTLPPEDRISDCLEGVPIEFRER